VNDSDPVRWTPIRAHLARFQCSFCPADMSALPLLLGSDRTWSDAEYRASRPKGFPGSLRGIYLLSDPVGILLYVGVAMWSFDKRFWSHDADMWTAALSTSSRSPTAGCPWR